MGPNGGGVASLLAAPAPSSPGRTATGRSNRGAGAASPSGRSPVCAAPSRISQLFPQRCIREEIFGLQFSSRCVATRAASQHTFPVAHGSVDGVSSEVSLAQAIQQVLWGHVRLLHEVCHPAKVQVWDKGIVRLVKTVQNYYSAMSRAVVTAWRAALLMVAGLYASWQTPLSLDMGMPEELLQARTLMHNLFNDDQTHEAKLAQITDCGCVDEVCKTRMKELADHAGLTTTAIEQLYNLASA
eukprot:scaffold67468_cov40-Prasinocladus_malaysianus.AAC.1